MAAQNSFLNNYGTGNAFLSGQSAAIKNGANSGSLISQLFAGKPAPVVAGAANVKSPNAPAIQPAAPVAAPRNVAPSSNMFTQGVTPPPVHTPAPTTQPIASHTTTDGAGNSTTIKYVPPTPTPTGNNTPAPAFGGIVGNLATQQNSQPNQNANTATGGLLAAPAQNAAIGQQIQSNNAQYAPEIAAITKGMVGQEVGDRTTGTAPVGEGNAAVTAAAGGQELQGLSQAEEANLASTGQQLTAQGQGQSGLTSAGGIANTQQGQAQSALASAGQLAQPVLGPIGAVPYSPTTGTQGEVLGSTQPGGVAAAGNLLGQFQGAQTVGSTGGAITSQQNTQVAAYKSAQQQGQNLASQATDLINTFGLNPSELNAANGAIQKIAENTSNPHYQALNNYLADISARYAQILTPPGGTATDTTRSVANGMLNNLMSGSSLKSVLDSLDQQANAVIAGVPTSQPNTSTNGGGGTMFGSFF